MNIKKGIVIISAILILGFTLNFVVATTSNDLNVSVSEFPVFINRTQLPFEQDILIVNNRTYVPLREIGDFLGFTTVWNEGWRRVEITIPTREHDFKEFGNRPFNAIRTTMTSLIANPRRYHNLYVSVMGILDFEDAPILYLSRDDWFYTNYRAGAWLSFDDDFSGVLDQDLNRLHGMMVNVVGVFDAEVDVPLNMTTIGLRDVSFVGRSLNRDERAELNQN